MKVKFEVNGGMSKEGFFHVPLLYFAFGRNGFTLTICCLNVLVAWNVKDSNHPVETFK